MTHADKDWIKIRAELAVSVVDDAAHGNVEDSNLEFGIAEAVNTLYNSPRYMAEYAEAMDCRLHGWPIPR